MKENMESVDSRDKQAMDVPEVTDGIQARKREKKSKINELSKKEARRGVVYLSCIPTAMTVKILREEFSKYGEVGNVFLEPDDKAPPHKHTLQFKEGWVEFFDKNVAKMVASSLNNSQVGGKKKHPWYADIWNIKYLPKFQWVHLNERLAYERAIHEQRLRAEISQIKKEAAFHRENYRKSKIKDKEERKQKKSEAATSEEGHIPTFKLRETEDEILKKKHKREGEDWDTEKKKKKRKKKANFRPDADHPFGALSLAANKSLMHKLFGGGDT